MGHGVGLVAAADWWRDKTRTINRADAQTDSQPQEHQQSHMLVLAFIHECQVLAG